MKRLGWMCAWLAIGCGGDDGKQAAPGRVDRDAGEMTHDGGAVGDDPRVTGGSRGDEETDGGDGSSSDGEGPRGGSDAGVEGAQILSELSDEQRERLCRAQLGLVYTEAAIAQECVVDATLYASDAASCDAYAKECAAEHASTWEADEQDILEECQIELSDCEYTVAQFERCVAEEAEEWERLTRAYSCEQAGTRDSSDEPELTISEECLMLQESCYFW